MNDYNELLVKAEQENIPEYYRDYYGVKRFNFLATIQTYPYLWNCYLSLDKTLVSEFDAMKTVSNIDLMFPMTLFMSSHAKMRIAFELGCSGCLAEAHSILRDSIEATAHGHRLARNPALVEVWMKRDDDAATKKRFKEEFEDDKAKRLFLGLAELHKLWKQFSDFGSHTNIQSTVERFSIEETGTHVSYHCNYTGSVPRDLLPALFLMIDTFHRMEQVLFDLCESRLKLDLNIPDARRRFQREKEQVRQHIISTLKLKPPEAKS